MRRTIACLAIFLCASLSTRALAEDLILRQRTSSGVGGPGRSGESTQYWSDGAMVTDSPETRVIIDFAGKTMTVANKQKKTYFTQTFDEIDQQTKAVRAEMEKQMAKLPPEARQMMDKMGMNPAGSSEPVKATPTGKTEKIAGYEAKEYQLQGPISGSVWITDALQLPVKPEDTAALAKGFGGTGGAGAKLAEALLQLKGMPLRSTYEFGGGASRLKTTTEVLEVSRQAPPPELMKVPSGYKKTAPPAMRRHAGH